MLAEARARAALAAERAHWSAAASMGASAEPQAEPASPEGGVVCLAGC